MSPVWVDGSVLWGVPDSIKKITNAPVGAKIKFRFRYNGFYQCFVRDSDGNVSRHWIDLDGENWKLSPAIGANITKAT